MKVTSAYANKMIRKLNEDKEFWLNKERNSCVYTVATEEEAVIPDYSYEEVCAKIDAIDSQIMKIRHALNVSNATNSIPVGDGIMSVDMILIKMAQLNNRKFVLDSMRKREPKTRLEARQYTNKKTVIEYQYINYDLDKVKSDYEAADAMISALQLALDRYNQTVEIEIDM